jgi:glutathione S-transferase
VAHETIECDLQNKSEDFIDVYKKANPGGRAKVPVLEIDGETLVESSVTVEYLAERSGAPFYPASAAKRASARLMAEIQPFQNYFAFIKVRDDKDALAKKVAEFEEAVENFETFLEIHQDGDGPFLCGSDMCVGEAMMAPFVVRCGPNLKHFCDVDVLEIARKHPRVGRLISAILERPSVKETSLSDEKIVEGMTRMMKMFASK